MTDLLRIAAVMFAVMFALAYVVRRLQDADHAHQQKGRT